MFKTGAKIILLIIPLCFLSLIPGAVFAQASLTLTIAPPLIKINMNPGESWSSAVKAVNNNRDPIKIYTQAVDFKSSENGGVAFIQSDGAEASERFRLSRWLAIEPGPIEIAAQASVEIPFTIAVPDEGEPGGHYAAIIVGTKPQSNIEGTGITVASQLASLIMLNVAGEVSEEGDIREFTADKTLYQEPKVKFKVRFANTGNVHLQPQGEIAVYDMQQKERARIPINHSTEFGNVLPDSTRLWEFEWEDDPGILKMGRYRADLILAYGERTRETVERGLYFWVIDLKLTAAVAGGILFLALVVLFSIRFYIRRAIRASQQAAGLITPAARSSAGQAVVIPRTNSNGHESASVTPRPLNSKIAAKRASFGWTWFRRWIAGILMLVAAIAGGLYLLIDQRQTAPLNLEPLAGNQLSAPENQGAAVIEAGSEPAQATATPASPGANATGTDMVEPEINPTAATTTLESAASSTPDKPKAILKPPVKEELISIKVLNGSGIGGLAGQAAEKIKAAGYTNVSTGNADHFNYSTTLIQHRLDKETAAGIISSLLEPTEETQAREDLSADIVVIIGKDYENAD